MRDTSAHKRTLRLTEEGGDEEMMVEVRGSYFHIWLWLKLTEVESEFKRLGRNFEFQARASWR
jgi:hypothetical protein